MVFVKKVANVLIEGKKAATLGHKNKGEPCISCPGGRFRCRWEGKGTENLWGKEKVDGQDSGGIIFFGDL